VVLDFVLYTPVLNCPKRISMHFISLRHGLHRKHVSSTVACKFKATLPSTGHPIVAYSLPRDVFNCPLFCNGFPSIVDQALVGTYLSSRCLALRHNIF
jgi:hypothetical protein